MVRIVGIDIGTSFGWACLDWPDQRVVAAAAFDLRIKSGEGAGMRLYNCIRLLTDVLTELRPGVVVYEDVRRHAGTTAAHVYGELRGGVLLVCEKHVDPQIPVTKIGVGAWKKAAVGRGNASKESVAESMIRMPGFPGGKLPHDVTDALGIAYGWARLNLASLRRR
jgi:Holliday junction resolvasome RuvABC endonuclease subunit